jgi:hypothetical protein
LPKLRTDVSVDDLAEATYTIWALCPNLRSLFVVGIEVPLPGDRNIVLHMKPHRGFMEEERVVMLSAEYILDAFNQDALLKPSSATAA